MEDPAERMDGYELLRIDGEFLSELAVPEAEQSTLLDALDVFKVADRQTDTKKTGSDSKNQKSSSSSSSSSSAATLANIPIEQTLMGQAGAKLRAAEAAAAKTAAAADPDEDDGGGDG